MVLKDILLYELGPSIAGIFLFSIFYRVYRWKVDAYHYKTSYERQQKRIQTLEFDRKALMDFMDSIYMTVEVHDRLKKRQTARVKHLEAHRPSPRPNDRVIFFSAGKVQVVIRKDRPSEILIEGLEQVISMPLAIGASKMASKVEEVME